MIAYYKTIGSKIEKINTLEKDCWINVIKPNEKEIEFLTTELGLDKGFLKSALDEEESSHIDSEDDQTLIIVDVPVMEKEETGTVKYGTVPLGIIITNDHIITVGLKQTTVISDFTDGLVKNINTSLKTRFVLFLLLRIATRFLHYLKQIDKLSNYIERQLHRSMKNKELIQLLDLEKSLVFFSTSLKSNEVTLEKLFRGRIIKLYEEDQDILEDVLIEVKQAIEMSNIYSNILSGTMDAFASVISNNLNIVMKRLTSITILMAIPTMIASFYGMNTTWLPFREHFWFPVVLSLVATIASAIALIRKKMF